MKRYFPLSRVGVFLILGIFLVFAGCDTGIGSYTPGDNLPDALLQSPVIDLPGGITVEEISGDSTSMDSAFPATIVLANSTAAPVDVTFSAGSNFWCTNDAAQNLIIVYDYTLTVPAGGTRSGTLPTYCLNSALDAPGEQDGYILGTVYTGGCMGTIISILSTKDPSSFDLFDHFTINDAIWECLEEGSITQDTLDLLNALP